MAKPMTYTGIPGLDTYITLKIYPHTFPIEAIAFSNEAEAFKEETERLIYHLGKKPLFWEPKQWSEISEAHASNLNHYLNLNVQEARDLYATALWKVHDKEDVRQWLGIKLALGKFLQIEKTLTEED